MHIPLKREKITELQINYKPTFLNEILFSYFAEQRRNTLIQRLVHNIQQTVFSTLVIPISAVELIPHMSFIMYFASSEISDMVVALVIKKWSPPSGSILLINKILQ